MFISFYFLSCFFLNEYFQSLFPHNDPEEHLMPWQRDFTEELPLLIAPPLFFFFFFSFSLLKDDSYHNVAPLRLGRAREIQPKVFLPEASCARTVYFQLALN